MSETKQAPAAPSPAPAPAPTLTPVNPQAPQPQNFINESPLPPSLRDRVRNVDDLIRQNANPQPAPAPEPQAPAQQSPAPTQEPQAPAPQPPAPAPEPPAPTDALADLRRQLERAQNDARTWEGRFRAQEQRAQTELEELRRQMAELQDTARRANASEAERSFQSFLNVNPLTQEEIDNYGPDMMAAIQRHAQALVAPALKAQKEMYDSQFAEIKAQLQQGAQTTQQTVTNQFLDSLSREISNWREVDVDPAFAAWLLNDDPLYGNRKILFDNAVAERNVSRVARFMKAFLADQGKEAQPPVPQPVPNPPAPQAPAEQESITLADFAAPGRAGPAGAAPQGQQPRVWPLSQIKAFYGRVLRGEYRSNPTERDAIEREIAAAQREGRVNFNA